MLGEKVGVAEGFKLGSLDGTAVGLVVGVLDGEVDGDSVWQSGWHVFLHFDPTKMPSNTSSQSPNSLFSRIHAHDL